jgi:protein O-mannosyl-transferase
MLQRASAAYALICAATLLTFARAIPYPLQSSWDDARFLVDNPYVQSVSLANLYAMGSRVHFEAFHPVHLLSYWLDVPWAGANAAVLHAVNALLWCSALCTFFAALRALGVSATSALLGTLIAGLHPVQVEAVSWATGRKDVLALLFCSASLLLHLRSQRAGDRAAWGSHACFVLAALSKTTTLPLPLVLIALDVVARDVRVLDAAKRQAPKLAATAGLGWLVIEIWQGSEMVRATAGGLVHAPLRLAVTWTHQLATALWPSATSPMYSTRSISTASFGALLGPLAVVLAALGLARLRQRLALAGLFAFALWMLPVSNLVPMYFPLQDRYLSLPLFGLAITLGALLDHTRSRLDFGVACVIVAALALRSVQYQGAWSSEPRLWGHAASTQPDAEYAWRKLSEVRRDRGELEGAIAAARRHVSIAPERKLAWAALFEVVALRDERMQRLSHPRARALAREYYDAMDDSSALRRLASTLLAQGYLRALELPLSRSLATDPPADALLEVAAQTQLRAGRGSIALLYLRAMRTPSTKPELAALRTRDHFPVLPERPVLPDDAGTR